MVVRGCRHWGHDWWDHALSLGKQPSLEKRCSPGKATRFCFSLSFPFLTSMSFLSQRPLDTHLSEGKIKMSPVLHVAQVAGTEGARERGNATSSSQGEKRIWANGLQGSCSWVMFMFNAYKLQTAWMMIFERFFPTVFLRIGEFLTNESLVLSWCIFF